MDELVVTVPHEAATLDFDVWHTRISVVLEVAHSSRPDSPGPGFNSPGHLAIGKADSPFICLIVIGRNEIIVNVESEDTQHCLIVSIPTQVYSSIFRPRAQLRRVMSDCPCHRIDEAGSVGGGNTCVGPEQITVGQQIGIVQPDSEFDKGMARSQSYFH